MRLPPVKTAKCQCRHRTKHACHACACCRWRARVWGRRAAHAWIMKNATSSSNQSKPLTMFGCEKALKSSSSRDTCHRAEVPRTNICVRRMLHRITRKELPAWGSCEGCLSRSTRHRDERRSDRWPAGWFPYPQLLALHETRFDVYFHSDSLPSLWVQNIYHPCAPHSRLDAPATMQYERAASGWLEGALRRHAACSSAAVLAHLVTPGWLAHALPSGMWETHL